MRPTLDPQHGVEKMKEAFCRRQLQSGHNSSRFSSGRRQTFSIGSKRGDTQLSSLTLDSSEGRRPSPAQKNRVSSETTKPQLLVIDHLGSIVNATNYNAFSEAGYAIDVAGSASKALSLLKGPLPDLILLEASLPGHSGYDLEAFIQSLRQVPLILISDDGSLKAKLQGLTLGADDYLANPYHLQELLTRISVLLRRWMNRHTTDGIVTIDRLTIDPARHQVFLSGKAVEIGFREFDVLSYFARNPRRFISRDELLNKVWNLPTPSVSHVVEVCINGLRKKLLDRDKQIIQSVRGLGYSLGKPEE